jgi:alpha-glucoside transport system substrate-binding protein
MVAPFEQQTGVKVQYEGTRDLNAVLKTRVSGGNPPDVAGLPGPGQMAEFANQGKLVDLSTFLNTQDLNSQYSQAWRELAQVKGKQVGIFIKAAAKGLIWYNPQVWDPKSWTVPKTWDDMNKLEQDMLATNVAPWSVALESSAASGWPGTDWIEDIVLRQAGTDTYDKWWQGQVKWSSDQIKSAWNTWGKIVGDPKMVFGGTQAMLATNFGDVPKPVFTTPPNAYMFHQGSFITSFITQANPDVKPLEGYNYFPFPQIGQSSGENLIVAGDLFGMFNDTPQARGLIQWLTTPQAQSIWVKRGGALSPNQMVAKSDYPDPVSQKLAATLSGAQTVKFDASDLMPEAMNNAFWKAILDFVQTPSNLSSILQNLDSVQADAYKS